MTAITRSGRSVALSCEGSARILLSPERAESLALAIRGAEHGPARVIYQAQRTAALLVAVVRPEPGGLYTVAVCQEGSYGWQACGWERVSWDDLLDVDDAIMKIVRPMRREIRRVEAAE